MLGEREMGGNKASLIRGSSGQHETVKGLAGFRGSFSTLHAAFKTPGRNGSQLDDGVESLIGLHRHQTREFLPGDFDYHLNILNTILGDRGTTSGRPDPE